MTLDKIFIFLIVGVIQIIGEMLPISSSSHIFLAKHFLKKIYRASPSSFSFSAYDHFLHGFTFITIIIFFRTRFFLMLKSLFCLTSPKASLLRLRQYTIHLVFLLFWTTLLSLAFYLPIKYLIKQWKNYYSLFQSIGLFVSILFLRLSSQEKKQSFSSLSIFIILGIVQGLAAFPGISRLGITYSTGKLLGLRSSQALYRSLLIHLPICLGGFLLGSYKLYKAHILISLFSPTLGFPLLIAALISYGALYGTYKLAFRNSLKWIGVYLLFPFVLTLFLYITRNP